jgi:FlaG/FlaF family flagellin (archaellin)
LRHLSRQVLPCLVLFGLVTSAFASPTPVLAASSACGAVRTFSGNGGKSLGTLTFRRDTTLKWTNDGGFFSILSDSDVPVNSQGRAGTTVISKGVLRKFQINAIGNWKIVLTPRCTSTASGNRFAGNGGKSLGTIVITRSSLLSWTNDGGFFSILTDSDVPVNSQGRKGTTVLDPGRYTHFQVNAIGNWTMTIEAR